ncbi:MAG TPA: class I SAM-dependent methyltransferase [Jiangellaceae bacterium]
MAWFDAHASDYDAWYDSELGRYADSVEKGLIEELAEPVPGERALDIGCGTGNHSIWLASKGLIVTGLDESPAMLAVAAAKTSGSGLAVDWVHGDAAALPFTGERFDLVVSVATMEFVEARGKVLRDAMRLLRPGGRLVLGLLTRDSPWGEFYLREAEERADSVFANAHFFTEDELPALLDAPYVLRKGLYYPPEPDLDRRVAEQVEKDKQARQEDRAGFFAVRWVKGGS